MLYTLQGKSFYYAGKSEVSFKSLAKYIESSGGMLHRFEELQASPHSLSDAAIILDDTGEQIDLVESIEKIRNRSAELPLILLRKSTAASLPSGFCRDNRIVKSMVRPVRYHEFMSYLSSLGIIDMGNNLDQDNDAVTNGVIELPFTVLIAEDEEMNMLLITRLIQSIAPQAKIVPVVSGLEAINQIQRESIDFVLMDVQMADLDGVSATIEIRKLEKELKMSAHPIIALTAGAFVDEKNRCIDAGMNGFLTKPIDVSKLKEVIDTWSKRGFKANELQVPIAINHEAHQPTILIVDDTEMNQVLIQRLVLQCYPHSRILLAGGGSDAIAYYLNEKLDLILMDIQMFEIDGLKMTSYIREFEEKSGIHIPIIGITAGNIHNSRQDCLKAGMDAFMSNPIDSKEFFSLLHQYLPFESLPLDENGQNHIEVPKMLADLIPSFLSNKLEQVRKMQEAVKSEDYEMLGALGHKIVGSAASYGFLKLGELAKEVEALSKKRELQAIKERVDLMLDHLQHVHVSVKEGKE